MTAYQGATQSTSIPFAGSDTGDDAPTFRLASRARRLSGFLLDSAFLLVPMVIISLAVLLPAMLDAETITLANGTSKFTDRGMNDIERAVNQVVLASVVVTAAYTVALTGLCRGQTLGKMALHTRVVKIADGKPAGMATAVVRYGVFALPGVVQLVLGFAGASLAPGLDVVFSLAQLAIAAWLIWDPYRQGLHDKVARTVVIDTTSEQPEEPHWNPATGW